MRSIGVLPCGSGIAGFVRICGDYSAEREEGKKKSSKSNIQNEIDAFLKVSKISAKSVTRILLIVFNNITIQHLT